MCFDERESVELVRTIEILLQIIRSSLKSLREMLLYYFIIIIIIIITTTTIM